MGVRLALRGRNGKAPQATLLLRSGRLLVQRERVSATWDPIQYFLDGQSVTLRDRASLREVPAY